MGRNERRVTWDERCVKWDERRVTWDEGLEERIRDETLQLGTRG